MNKLIGHIKEMLSASTRFAFLFTACIGAFICEWSVSDFSTTRVVNLVENIAFSCTLFAFFELFQHRMALWWFRIVFYLLLVFSVVEGVYYLIFDAELSSSAIFIALDTNTSEASEFLDFNFNNSHLIYVLGVFLSFFLSWVFLSPSKKAHQKNYPLLIIVLSLGVMLMSKPKIYQYNFPYVLSNSILEYNREQKTLNDIHEKENPFINVVALNQTPTTHVIIIGESTSRLHFGMYGYKRNTTPRLEEIKDEIYLFEDVISGHTYTVGSLVKALTIKKGDSYVGNVIQLFKQAGYNTYWLSNQPPIGIYETLVTKIALSANHSSFVNLENPSKNTSFDGVLLPELEQILKDQKSKKIIFMHLMGTHAKYAFRYPESYGFYPTNLDDEKQNTVNHYDNAVMYNDYIIRNIIEKLRLLNMPSSLTFFSDHGEEVYDEIDFVGHPANGMFTLNLVEIPFLIWSNPKIDFFNNLKKRKFILNDLSHSLADLYQIQSNEIDTTRSLFHKSYIERPRVVWDSILVD
jgi:heptose-I-phosphate ethanolaminephosphotransferase